MWSSTKYSGLLESTEDPATGAEMAFGVNFGTGHIKAYSIDVGPTHFVRCVRGAAYGVNDFLDNRDGTITDRATGLMWAQADNGAGVDWEDALAYAETQNASSFLGYDDWRLPSVKELQSIVDYTRSPGATDAALVGPAIDPMFTCTPITNEARAADYPWYWTSTTQNARARDGCWVHERVVRRPRAGCRPRWKGPSRGGGCALRRQGPRGHLAANRGTSTTFASCATRTDAWLNERTRHAEADCDDSSDSGRGGGLPLGVRRRKLELGFGQQR
ncbi:MAG: DUF1566 domain-containing protein [Candidatus Moduliflexus flocculans]|nr:DUF1566 domain-containing protein [Candidatus Moduliflexus flocculans]